MYVAASERSNLIQYTSDLEHMRIQFVKRQQADTLNPHREFVSLYLQHSGKTG